MPLFWSFLAISLFCAPERGSAVRGPVFVEEPPPWLDVSNSTGVVLSCKAHGTPSPVIRWLDQSDKEVTHLPRIREILHNGSLYLPPFSGENFRPDVHSTSYRCLATNSVGTIVSRECKLRPDLQESYPLQVEETMTLRGNIAILRCGVSPSHSHKYALSWLKEDSIHGRTTLHPGGRFSVTSAGALHIRSVSIEDSYARYYCQVTNRLTGSRRVSRPGKIVVTDSDGNIPPRIEYSLPSVHARVGSTTELECAAQGSPPPSYRWYRIIDESLLEEIRPGSILVRPLDSILQFTRVRVDDSGRYVCVAANILGEDRRELSLAVKSPLTVHIHPQYQVVDGGSTTTINCTVDGGDGGRTVIAWLKDGRSVVDSGQFQVQNDGGVLLLNSVSKYDKGMYQCLARNGDETAQASAELVLEAIPPELHSTFIEQTIQPGISVSLHCVASGTPVPRVNWFLNGGPLLTRGGYVFGSYLDSTGDLISQLNITVTRVQHGGLYTCTAKNTLGSVSHSAALNVYGPPTSRAPLNLTVVSGKDVHLLCPVAGFPVSGTTWQLGQDSLPLSFRQRVFLNGTLLVANVDVETDKGEYRCTVRNQQGQAASGKVYLNIMEPPEIQPFHFPEKLQEGKRTQLSCTIVSGDFPIDISWYKDSRPLSPDSDLQEQNHNFVSVLLFRKLAARHAGHYTCVARNAAAQTNYTAKLVIRVAPSWITEPQDMSVLFQHPAAIHCQATGFPKPRITWMKLRSEDSNDFVQVEEILGMRVSANGTLLIRSTEPSHEGSYSCQAANGVGSVLKKNIFVNINVPAYFKERIVNESGVAGEDRVLMCEAEGDRPLRLTWSSTPPLQLPPAHTRHTASGAASELHLRSLSRHDAGAYYCAASNQFGQDSMVIHLAVREPPEAPTRVEVVEVGSRWLSMRWAPPTPGLSAPITQYVVQFQEDSSLQWANVTVGGNLHSTKLNALVPATVYTLRLIAVNQVGAGPPSHTTHAVTLQEVPSKAPEDVIAEANAPESLLIKWRPIPMLSSKEEILGFQVSYREMTKGAPETRTVRGAHKHELQLTGLRSYARYELTVRAINQVGPGPASAPLVATTLEGVPEEAPQDVRCAALSSQSLRIRWEPPSPEHHNGLLQGYKVVYKLVNPNQDGPYDSEVKKTTNLETNLHNLSKFTNYSIRVLAFTTGGEGILSSPIFCNTEEDVPGTPEQVKALIMTSESVLVTWTRPSQPNGVILRYNVYIQLPNKDVINEIVFGDREHSHECRKLKEFNRYEFWVTASTSVGEGQPSAKVSQTPLSRVPARIASFSSKIVGKAGGQITLGCQTVGLPAPTRTWWGPTGATLPTDPSKQLILADRSLKLGPLTLSLAGNYSCHAENVFGRDHVAYQVVVMVPPVPPILAVTESTTNSLFLHWKVVSDGGSPLTGYILSYRKQNEEWQHLPLEQDRRSYNLDKLQCGSAYEIELQATNSVGNSKPSAPVRATTKGEVPGVAEQDDLIAVNSTSAMIFLESWPERGCPVQHFQVFYRAHSQAHWQTFGGGAMRPHEDMQLSPHEDIQLRPHEDIQLVDLTPATKYHLQVVVFSDAGSARHEYVFATRSRSGEVIPLELIPEEPTHSLVSLNIMVPVVSGVFCTIALTLCACVLSRKRQYTGYKAAETSNSKSIAELENQRNFDQQGHHSPHSLSPPSHKTDLSHNQSGRITNDNSGDYEISPYATFSLPNQAAAHSLQFQTFSQHDCYEGRPMKDYHYARGRSKSSSSKIVQDALSLEISCISTQQTLPVGRKGGGGAASRNSSTVFMSDSDSSAGAGTGGGAPHTHQLPSQSIGRRNTGASSMYDQDSSTESAEASPEMNRKHRSRRLVSPRCRESVPLHPPQGFSDSRELSETECDQNQNCGGGLRILRHEQLEQQLSNLVKRYRQERDREKQDYTIHV
ncbi:Down syndrome cell adhesion molecule-like protein Dscam2 [Nilaparvata lugens]|uniref:Down syndrome cell adhesion molecule-like protein Dscam2 n=1 Tax=Nilaparvata lugens TaxID=108931 RepID=UPI00193D46B5|nr:Down syndrome cell adhesion molecule-like protein Dscam2 [Nilaparvata lugens]